MCSWTPQDPESSARPWDLPKWIFINSSERSLCSLQFVSLLVLIDLLKKKHVSDLVLHSGDFTETDLKKLISSWRRRREFLIGCFTVSRTRGMFSVASHVTNGWSVSTQAAGEKIISDISTMCLCAAVCVDCRYHPASLPPLIELNAARSLFYSRSSSPSRGLTRFLGLPRLPLLPLSLHADGGENKEELITSLMEKESFVRMWREMEGGGITFNIFDGYNIVRGAGGGRREGDDGGGRRWRRGG